jgi:soluble lytic murein transglycosylase-like protein
MAAQTQPQSLPADVAALLDAAADRYGIPRIYPRAVAWVESRGRQSAVGTSGELGVMQLMPATAAWLEVDPRSLVQNIDGGVRYLSQLVRQFGERNGIASYNAGPTRAGARPETAWPASTKQYVAAVTSRADYEARTIGVRTAAAPFDQGAPLSSSWVPPHSRCLGPISSESTCHDT